MLPNAEDSVAAIAQSKGHGAVAGAVSVDFGIPVFAVRAGAAVAAGAAVPEAAIDEQDEAFSAEDEIRFSGHGQMSAPAVDAGGAKDGNEAEFGGFVPP